MRIDIISAVPALLDGPLNHSIVKRAREKKLVHIYLHDLEITPKISTKKWMITPMAEMPVWC